MTARRRQRTGPSVGTPKIPARPDPPAAENDDPDEASPFIVAVGASAGGLQAFEAFLSATPADAPYAIVYIQHLEPTHRSHIVDLVGPYSQLEVQPAEDGQRVARGNVYVGPPGQYVTIADGVLHLTDMGERRGVRYPIDRFFRSLAEDQGDRAIGVVLTGTGSDGTAGVKAIKAAGGTVYVQDPETAEQRGMPASAIQTDLVDEVLAIDKMPQRIAGYVEHPFIQQRPRRQDGDRDAVLPLLARLNTEGAVDFRHYKTLTLKRRIERRMGLNHIGRLSEYSTFLEEHADERKRLQKDLLISVTEFFRDADAWETFARDALPRLMEPAAGRPLRVWSAGCATGEEVYTVMMLLLDHLGRGEAADTERGLQVFATDVNQDALDVARAGIYPAGALEQVPAEYVQRFFRKLDDGDHRQVVGTIREPVTFALHDLLSDPPFSKLDLITCRNLLIYLTPEAQARVLKLFHFALRPGGILFLGSAEGRGDAKDGFEVVSKKWRIYRRKEGPPLQQEARPESAGSGVGARPAATVDQPAATAPRRRPESIAERAKIWLIHTYAPAAVVINHDHEILYLHGPLDRYLELPDGEPALDLSQMPREGLRPRLRVAVRQAMQTKQRVDLHEVPVHRDGLIHHVDVRVEPLTGPDAPHPLFIVAFQDSAAAADPRSTEAPSPRDERQAAWVERLEDELQTAQDDLRATIEELESANERLRASNEEILSMNEEFRSTNEELETSKEELQSLNEELTALNTQLRHKVETLEATTNDLENLLRSTDIPTVFLDEAFRIRLFTPSMRRLMNLIPADVGRPLADITRKFEDRSLLSDLEAVRDELIPREAEIAYEGHRYLRHVQPYRTTDDRITGVVLTFLDIESVKRAADAVDVARRYAEGIVETLREPILVLDEELRVLSANAAFYQAFGYDPSDAEGRHIYRLGGGEWEIPAMRDLLERVLPIEPRRTDFEIEHQFSKIGHRTMVINAQRILRPLGPDGRTGHATLLAFDDITERKAAAEADAAFKGELERRVRQRTADLERSNRILREANEALDAFSYVVGHDLKEPTRAIESLLSVIEEDHAHELAEGVAPLIAQVRAANRRLSALVVGLLRFSRTATSGPAEPVPVRIGDLLEDPHFTARFEALLKERRARLDVETADTQVLAEPEVLGQVLANLILNGLTHDPKDPPRIRIRTDADHALDEVHLVIEDDGPGFPGQVIATFRTGVSSTRDGGFGLVIAKRGVTRMQGRIWLDRSPLGGAAVHMILPAPRRATATKAERS